MKAVGAFLTGMSFVLWCVLLIIVRQPDYAAPLLFALYLTGGYGCYFLGHAYGRAESEKKHENHNR